MKILRRGYRILKRRLTEQGLRTTAWWAADHAARVFTGANMRHLSQVTPHLHVGGQHRRHGMSRLESRGITAVVNMRIEYDDEEAGVATERYLHLPTVDDHAATSPPPPDGRCRSPDGYVVVIGTVRRFPSRLDAASRSAPSLDLVRHRCRRRGGQNKRRAPEKAEMPTFAAAN